MGPNWPSGYSSSGSEQLPDESRPSQFELPAGIAVPCFPSGVIPPVHWELAHSDPTAMPIDLAAIFSEEGQPADSNASSSFELPNGEMVSCFPSGVIPSICLGLVHSDPITPPIDLDKLFSKDLELTDAKGGIRSQKANRNIAEIAEAISNRYEMAVVGKQLYRYEPPCWRALDRDESMRFIADAVQSLFREDEKYLSRAQYRDIAYRLCNQEKNRIVQIPALDYNYLCCRDAMYDWHSRKCIPHESSYMRFSFLDIDAAEIGQCDGEHWELFLNNLTGGDVSLRQRILEVIGVILSGYPSKSFFVLEGESGTGKSQLVNFFRDVLGTSACFAVNDIDQLSNKWTPGSLVGKLLCICGDIPQKTLSSKTIGTIKQLTGDDLIRGELKYQDAFTFDNTAKLLFASNFPLQISGQKQDEALLNRLVVLPCHNPVPHEDQIPGLHKLLHQEAGYIIDLAMDALAQLEERNGAFTPLPPDLDIEVIQAPDVEQEIMDFVYECCVLEDGASCTVAQLFAGFQDYTHNDTLDTAQFSIKLRQLYPRVDRKATKNARLLTGIRMKIAEDKPPAE